MLVKIVTGAQTGADRAALDFALHHGLDAGGWVPRGRLAEDGRIADRYTGLKETASSNPAERTRLNVRDSDATVIVSNGAPIGGSRFTLDEAHRQGKPVLHLDLQALGLGAASARLRAWLADEQPSVLNVAGSRASEDAGIYTVVTALLQAAVSSVLETPGGRVAL